MVGGYDRRVLENVEYHEELEQLAGKQKQQLLMLAAVMRLEDWVERNMLMI